MNILKLEKSILLDLTEEHSKNLKYLHDDEKNNNSFVHARKRFYLPNKMKWQFNDPSIINQNKGESPRKNKLVKRKNLFERKNDVIIRFKSFDTTSIKQEYLEKRTIKPERKSVSFIEKNQKVKRNSFNHLSEIKKMENSLKIYEDYTCKIGFFKKFLNNSHCIFYLREI